MSKATILIVDDDRLVLHAFERGLREAGYEILTAESGSQAVELCRQSPPGLVLLDIRMPGMSGLDVAQWLRAETEIPFIFLSAYDDRATVRQAAEYGALGYLVKPVDMPQVIAALESALARAVDIARLKKVEADLNRALASGREVSTATGILMERHRLSEKQAFEALRSRARAGRIKVQEVANEIIRADEALNAPPLAREN